MAEDILTPVPETPPQPPKAPAGPPWYRTVTGWILAVNFCVFLVQLFYDNQTRMLTDKGALSLAGVQAGHWWQLLTFQVLHGGELYLGWTARAIGVVHLGTNCLVINVMGRVLEPGIGKLRLLRVYVLCGILGGLLHLLLAWLWPSSFDSAVVGASAGAIGLLAMFTSLFPQEKLRVLLFFLIPMTMKGRTLLWSIVIFSLIGLAGVMHDGIGHAAHLGGILGGIFFARQFLRRRPLLTPR